MTTKILIAMLISFLICTALYLNNHFAKLVDAEKFEALIVGDKAYRYREDNNVRASIEFENSAACKRVMYMEYVYRIRNEVDSL